MWSVFTTIAAWCANIGKGIGFWFREAFKAAFAICKSWWGICLIIGSCGWIALHDIKLTLGALLQTVGTINSPGGISLAPPGGFAYWLSVANTFTPLEECIGYLNLYLHLVVGWGIYKFIKSYSVVAQGGGA